MNKGMNRIISIGVSALLSISTFLTVIPQTETIVYADDVTEVSTIEQLSGAISSSSNTNPTKIRITTPITLDNALYIQNNQGIEIIEGELIIPTQKILYVHGILKMSGGTITIYGDDNGGYVYVANGGSFIMSGGTITSYGTLCVYSAPGSFIMNGGTLTTSNANGVCVGITDGVFTMNGGTIINSANNGFAVKKYRGTYNHNSGTVTGNVAEGLGSNTTTMCVVTFHANNGTNATNSQVITPGTSTPLNSLSTVGFTYDNHTFQGWAESASATSAGYTDGQSVTLTENKQLYAVWEEDAPTSYTVTMSDDGNGTASASPTSGATNTEVTVTATPNSNYHFKEWQVISGGVTLSSTTTNPATFGIGTANVEIKAIFEQNSSSGLHTITVTDDGHGRAHATPTSESCDGMITLSATPSTGYEFDRWTSTQSVNFANSRSANTTFRMLDQNVTVKANFKAKSNPKKDDDDDDHHEESSSPEKPSWTPAKAAATIAAQKAQKQQAAASQLASIQTMLRTKTSDRVGTGRNVIDLDMTKVDILDPATVNLLLLNNRFAFNVKISVPGGLTTTIMIPANFNFRPFIKADGTMNIHEVLWWIISKKK